MMVESNAGAPFGVLWSCRRGVVAESGGPGGPAVARGRHGPPARNLDIKISDASRPWGRPPILPGVARATPDAVAGLSGGSGRPGRSGGGTGRPGGGTARPHLGSGG